MADIGELNITINSNADEAAKGLGALARNLGSVKEKASGFDLSNVQTNIENIVGAVKGSEKTMSSLGTLLNASSTYFKTFGSASKQISINLEPLKQLKTTIGEGFKLGNAGSQLNQLRTALAAEWNTSNIESIGSALSTIAKGAEATDTGKLAEVATNVSSVAKALVEYADAAAKVKDVLGSSGAADAVGGGISMTFSSGGSDTYSAFESAENELESITRKAENVATTMTSSFDDEVHQFEQTGSELDGLMQATESVTDAIGNNSNEVKSFSNEVNEYFKNAVSTIHEMGNADVMQGASQSIDKTEKALENGISLVDLMRQKVQIMTHDMNVLASHLSTAGEDPLESERVVNYMISIMKLNNEIEKMVQLNEQATRSNEGMDKVTGALSLSNAELMTQKYEAMKSTVAQAYDAGKLNEEQFYTATLRIQSFGEKVVEAGGQIDSSANEATQAINSLFRSLDQEVDYSGLATFINTMQGINKVPVPEDELKRSSAFYTDFAKNVEGLYNVLERDIDYTNLSGIIARMHGIGQESVYTQEMVERAFMSGLQGDSPLAQQMRDLNPELTELSDAAVRAGVGFNDLEDAEAALEPATSLLDRAFQGLSSGIKGLFPTLSGLIKRFKSIATMRALRYIIRQITSGISEGMENLYYYSDTVGTNFAPALDTATSTLTQFKNSVAAAASPLLTSLVPAIQTLVSWLITAVNYLNQFFSLLSGSTTWTKAVYNQADAYDDVKKSASGASDATKDLLADWDELNIIQSNSSGGGGGSGSSTTDYSSMFEEVSEYAEWIKELVNGIEDQFGSIWNLVKKIAAVILTWKISTAFKGVLAELSGLLAALGIVDLVFNISMMFNKSYLKTGDVGWLVADLLTTLIGSVLMQKVLTNVLGGSLATLPIPLTFAVSALASLTALVEDTDVSALSEKGLLSALNTALKGGVASGAALYLLSDLTLGQSIAAGAGGAIFTFGVVVGLKAIAEAADARGITADVIKEDFLSAGSIAAGLAIVEIAAGGTATSALALAGGGGLFVLGALITIEAIIAGQPKSVKWGDIKLTEDEIKAFAEDPKNGLFKVDPQVSISLVNATVESLGEKKADLEEKIAKAVGTLQVAKVGLKSNALEDVTNDVNALVTSFNSAADAQQEALEVAVSLVPVKNQEGKDITSDVVTASAARWDELKGIVEAKGKELVEAYSIAYNTELDATMREDAEKSIAAISEMLIAVASAVANGQAKAKAMHVLNVQFSDLSQATMDSLIETYKQQRDQLIEELTKARTESAESVLAQQYAYEELAEYALEKAGGDTTDETYKHYKDQAEKAKDEYEALLYNLKEQVEETVDKTFANSETTSKITNALNDMIETGLIKSGHVSNLDTIKNTAYDLRKNIYKQLFTDEGIGTGSETETVTQWLNKLISDVYGQDAGSIIKAIESNLYGYGKIISEDVVNYLAEQIGITEAPQEVQDAWSELLSKIFRTPDSTVADKAKETVNEVVEEVKDATTDVDSTQTTVPLDLGVGMTEYSSQRIASEVKDTVEKAVATSDPVEVTAKVEVSTIFIDEVREAIEDAVSEANVDLKDNVNVDSLAGQLYKQFGAYYNIEDIKSYINQLVDTKIDETSTGTSGSMGQPWRTSASAGGSSVKYGGTNKINSGETTSDEDVIDYNQMTASVKNGTQSANTSMVSELQVIASRLQALLNKNWTVNITPSSTLGSVNAKSGTAWNKVTGDMV